jgi:hypothetical protein
MNSHKFVVSLSEDTARAYSEIASSADQSSQLCRVNVSESLGFGRLKNGTKPS